MLIDTNIFPNAKDVATVFLGINRLSEYERNFLADTNLRIGIIFAAMVLAFETFMLGNNFIMATKFEVVEKIGYDWIIQHRIAYALEFTSALLLLGCGLFHILKRPLEKWVSSAFLAQLLVMSLAFGVYITFGDIQRGNGMYVILIIIVAIACLFFIRPSLTVPPTFMALQSMMMVARNSGELSHAIALNLYIFFFIIAVASCVRYLFAIQVARTRELLEIESKIDALTGVGNIRAFNTDASEFPGGEIALTMIDVDNFKICNDIHGHSTGDRLLVLLTSILRDEFDGSAYCYRVGGNEFLVISDSLTQEQQDAKARCARRALRSSALAREIESQGGSVDFTWGTAFGTVDDVNEILALKRAADKAMYDAKQSKGRRAKPEKGQAATSSS